MTVMSFMLPDWLFGKAVDSGPGAYGDLAPELRARLKSQIAFLHNCLGESPPWSEQRLPWLDRSLTRRERPLDWALFGLSASYASGPGLLAALLPAILAGCGDILICRLAAGNSAPLPLALSAALELLGQEQLFELSAAEFTGLQEELSASGARRGRAVLLGNAELPLFTGSRLPERFRLLLDPDCGADLDLLCWAQPGADLVEARPGDPLEIGSWLALLTDRPGAYAFKPDLWLAPGSESFWIWPQLPLSWFRARQAGIGGPE